MRLSGDGRRRAAADLRRGAVSAPSSPACRLVAGAGAPARFDPEFAVPASEFKGSPPVRRDEAVALAAILVVALALRLPGLNGGLWYDEIFTLVNYVRLPVVDLLSRYDSLNNHLFYSLQAKAMTGLFGEAPWALRVPALAMGIASIWMLWRLARAVVTPGEALLAALLMTVSYHHVWMSQNARGYTGLLFFGLAATLVLLRNLQARSWQGWGLYGLLLALSMYTHLSAAFLFFAQGLAYLAILAGRLARGRGLALADITLPAAGVGFGLALTLLLYAPVFGQIGGTFAEVQGGSVTPEVDASIAEWNNPLWTAAEIMRGLGPLLGTAVPVVIAVLALACVRLWRRAALLPLSFVFHVAATMVLLVALGFRIWPRYFFVDIGLICLFLVHGAAVIGQWLGPRLGFDGIRAGLGLAALGIAASLVILPRNYLYPKQDFPAAVAFVERSREPGAQVLTLDLSAFPFSYYAPGWTGIADAAAFDAAYDPSRETWLVYTFPDVMKRRHAALFDRHAAAFEEQAYFPGTLVDGGIVVLRAAAKD